MQTRWQQILFSGWHFMRLVRLVFGTFFLVCSIVWMDMVLALAALVLLFQALTTIGCCSAKSCFSVTSRNKQSDDIAFEEVKS